MKKFMRTRAPPEPPRDYKTNGHAGGEDAESEEGGPPLWEDPEFPPHGRALGGRLAPGLRWLRPHELSARPRFRGDDRVGRAGSEDSTDEWGCEGDSWCVSPGAAGSAAVCTAAAALAYTPRLMDRVAPPQSFQHNYTGQFRFLVYVWGSWRAVCVDDRLAARGGRLLAARPARPHDYTLPLLEKALAKVYGGWGALRAAMGGVGGVGRALQELCGGVAQGVELGRGPGGGRAPGAGALGALLGAAPRATLLLATGPRRAALVQAVGGAPPALRLRLLLEPDTTLPTHHWLGWEEVCARYERLELVHVGPDEWLAEPALRVRRAWRAVTARRRWRRGYNAGGPPAAETTGANPQFHVGVGPPRCHCVVSVMQLPPSPPRAGPLHRVGFAVYELPPDAPPRPAPLPLRGLRALEVRHESRAREVAAFFTLPAGRYLVVPHTRRPHTDAAFLLRILTDDPADVWELNEDNTIARDCTLEFMEELYASPAGAAGAAGAGGELDARALRGVVRAPGSVCRALVALRDAAGRGSVAGALGPALAALLARWRAAWRAEAGGGRGALRLRALLRAAGVAVSNKVLEALVQRCARSARLAPRGYLLALARLHLAHERFRRLDAQLKWNPVSLEEMILMTVYM